MKLRSALASLLARVPSKGLVLLGLVAVSGLVRAKALQGRRFPLSHRCQQVLGLRLEMLEIGSSR